MHFFIHNSIHAGDVILTRPVIKAIKENFPDVKITLECMEVNKYLWEDLGLPIMAYAGNRPYYAAAPTPNCPSDALFINIWFGLYRDILRTYQLTYDNTVHTFNRLMQEKGLYHLYQLHAPEFPPSIEFYAKQQLPLKIVENSVLVENGIALSTQNNFPINDYLEQISKAFPELVFYCSAEPPIKASNVVDCSKLNLLQLSELSNHCKGLLVRGSGVNTATYTEPNRFKPRCYVGMTRPTTIWLDKRNPPVEVKDITGVLSFLQTLVSKNSDLSDRSFKMCKFLKSKAEIDECTDYLIQNGYAAHSISCKNWDIAHIVSKLSDGNLLDMGSTDSYILKNAVIKKLQGEKYGVDLRKPNVAADGVKYIVGNLLNIPLPDNYFSNITCLSVIEHDVDFEKFAKEASRLLASGGKLYVTFDYWVPKIITQKMLTGLKWQPLDDKDVKALINYCHQQNLQITEDIDWSVGEKVIRPGYYSPDPKVSYTFGMLVFKKCINK